MNQVDEAILAVDKLRAERERRQMQNVGPIPEPAPLPGKTPEQVAHELGIGQYRQPGDEREPEPVHELDTGFWVADIQYRLFPFVRSMLVSGIPLTAIMAAIVEAAGIDSVLQSLKKSGYIDGFEQKK